MSRILLTGAYEQIQKLEQPIKLNADFIVNN